MPGQMTQTIQLKSQAGQTSHAEMTLRTYSGAERKKRAILILVACWIGAAACIPFMIVHLVLIPGFLIAGVVMAVKRWRTDKEAESVSGTCPACDKAITINLDKKLELPQWQYCPSCNDSLELDALPETAAAQA